MYKEVKVWMKKMFDAFMSSSSEKFRKHYYCEASILNLGDGLMKKEMVKEEM